MPKDHSTPELVEEGSGRDPRIAAAARALATDDGMPGHWSNWLPQAARVVAAIDRAAWRPIGEAGEPPEDDATRLGVVGPRVVSLVWKTDGTWKFVDFDEQGDPFINEWIDGYGPDAVQPLPAPPEPEDKADD